MKKEILIIDDDPVTIEMLRGILEKHGYKLRLAYNGAEGLAKAGEKIPDLIILDIQMPKMDGYTFLLEFKKIVDVTRVPILVLTTKENMQDIFAVEGIKEYITKPYKMEDLLQKIEHYLGKS